MKHVTHIDGRLFGVGEDGRIGRARVTYLVDDVRQRELRAKLDNVAYQAMDQIDPVQQRLRGVVYDLGTIRALLEAGEADDALQVVRYATHRIAELLAIDVSPSEARRLDLPTEPNPACRYRSPLEGDA